MSQPAPVLHEPLEATALGTWWAATTAEGAARQAFVPGTAGGVDGGPAGVRGARARVRRDRPVLLGLRSRHLVPWTEILDMGTATSGPGGGDAALVLLCPQPDGVDLATRIGRSGPLAPGLALAVGAQVCWGLTAAHAAGLAHGALTAADVWVSPVPGGVRALLRGVGVGDPAARHDDVRAVGSLLVTMLADPADAARGAPPGVDALLALLAGPGPLPTAPALATRLALLGRALPATELPELTELPDLTDRPDLTDGRDLTDRRTAPPRPADPPRAAGPRGAAEPRESAPPFELAPPAPPAAPGAPTATLVLGAAPREVPPDELHPGPLVTPAPRWLQRLIRLAIAALVVLAVVVAVLVTALVRDGRASATRPSARHAQTQPSSSVGSAGSPREDSSAARGSASRDAAHRARASARVPSPIRRPPRSRGTCRGRSRRAGPVSPAGRTTSASAVPDSSCRRTTDAAPGRVPLPVLVLPTGRPATSTSL